MGMRMGPWFRLLQQCRYDVDAVHVPRALVVSLCSVVNSLLGPVEELLCRTGAAGRPAPEALIVVGAPSSGTTYLYNLLVQDNRFGYPNLYQVTNPHTFLLTERLVKGLTRRWVGGRRLQDNVEVTWDSPAEPEFALNVMTPWRPVMSILFPRQRDFFDRCGDLATLSPEQFAEWQRAFRLLLAKLAHRDGRPLVLKSPSFFGCSRQLQRVLPAARYVHIHRHPYEVYASRRRALERIRPVWEYQRREDDDFTEHWLRWYGGRYDRYFADRETIGSSRLFELSFEELRRDPVGSIERTYQALGIEGFATVEPELRAYTESLRGYQANPSVRLPGQIRERIAERCWRCFDEWGYAP